MQLTQQQISIQPPSPAIAPFNSLTSFNYTIKGYPEMSYWYYNVYNPPENGTQYVWKNFTPTWFATVMNFSYYNYPNNISYAN